MLVLTGQHRTLNIKSVCIFENDQVEIMFMMDAFVFNGLQRYFHDFSISIHLNRLYPLVINAYENCGIDRHCNILFQFDPRSKCGTRFVWTV